MLEPDDDEPLVDRTIRMRPVAIALARALLAEGGERLGWRRRAVRALGRDWPWLDRLTRRIYWDFGATLSARQHDALVATIIGFTPFRAAFETEDSPRVRAYFPYYPPMAVLPRALAGLNLPVLETPGDVARWLCLTPTELDGFADHGAWRGEAAAPPAQHYSYRWRPKARGGLRLIEAPKPRLRALQHKILREILQRVPVHEAAHGCVKGRSALTHAQTHIAAPMLLQLDLAEFFTRIRASRIHALFETLGYPTDTARVLTGLVTHCTPRAVVRAAPLPSDVQRDVLRESKASLERLRDRHLPQGAPTSPALANLCAYRLDLRLAGAAASCGARYTRYVDDLAFSCASPNRARAQRLAQMCFGILLEEGFLPNPRKTRYASNAQSQRVTGIVVNTKANIPRKDFDHLKAILTNCIRFGPETQNRDGVTDFRAHVQGRVAYVEQLNPLRGIRLKRLFDCIDW